MRRILVLCCAIVFLDTSFYAAMTPLLPGFEDEYGLSKTAAGVLAAAYPAGTFAGALPGGYLAAKVGVRATVVLGLAIMVLSSLAFAFAGSDRRARRRALPPGHRRRRVLGGRARRGSRARRRASGAGR